MKLFLLLTFFAVNLFAAGKIQDADVKSLAELTAAGGGAAQLINDSKIYVTASGLNTQLSTAISTGLIGGGGGSSLQWSDGLLAPIQTYDAVNNRVYLFGSGLGQTLVVAIKVPNTYGGGQQIKIIIPFYSPDVTGTALVQSVSTLIKNGVDAITSVTNQRTSTNAAVTLTTANVPSAVTLDLTSTTGQINGVSVAANDIILVTLQRGTDTATSDLRVLTQGSELLLR